MIPHFPEFKKLTIDDRKSIEEITRGFEPFSDYNFVSLFCWDTKEEVEISRFYDNLIVLFVDYINGERFYSFIGLTHVDETIDKLIDQAKKEGMREKLGLIPEPVIENIKESKKYIIEEDRDGFDYILSVSDLVELKGSKYHPKKNFINRYKKAYEDVTHVKELTLSDKETKENVLKLFYEWEKSRGKDRKETENELNAIKKLLEHSHLLDLKTIGLFINNELKGFAINELISDEHGIAHFEKVDVSHVGIFQYLKHQTALMFHEQGTKFMNIEQDLGIESLRKAKESLYPVKFLKKYTVRLKQ
ncbi:MAG TPA: phosphatidylglycerol lysyltransferase domain-containing protein [Patescibacteria group bacterium]|nr:phosphatidylglycerol lysyltransferase domain-containing protein [Patescibacteria group bacterium]